MRDESKGMRDEGRQRLIRLSIITVLVMLIPFALWLVAERGSALQEEQSTNLTLVCRLANPVSVRMLLEEGADPNAREGVPSLSLWQRALRMFKSSYAAGGTSALELAARAPHSSEAVKLLLDHGARIDAQPNDADNILYAAIWSHNEGVVKLLLTSSTGQTYPPQICDNALSLAARAGDAKLVSLFLARGCDPNRYSALFAAITSNNPAVVRLLLDHGAKVRADEISLVQGKPPLWLDPSIIALVKKAAGRK